MCPPRSSRAYARVRARACVCYLCLCSTRLDPHHGQLRLCNRSAPEGPGGVDEMMIAAPTKLLYITQVVCIIHVINNWPHGHSNAPASTHAHACTHTRVHGSTRTPRPCTHTTSHHMFQNTYFQVVFNKLLAWNQLIGNCERVQRLIEFLGGCKRCVRECRRNHGRSSNPRPRFFLFSFTKACEQASKRSGSAQRHPKISH